MIANDNQQPRVCGKIAKNNDRSHNHKADSWNIGCNQQEWLVKNPLITNIDQRTMSNINDVQYLFLENDYQQ